MFPQHPRRWSVIVKSFNIGRKLYELKATTVHKETYVNCFARRNCLETEYTMETEDTTSQIRNHFWMGISATVHVEEVLPIAREQPVPKKYVSKQARDEIQMRARKLLDDIQKNKRVLPVDHDYCHDDLQVALAPRKAQ